ncbi:branched-chain amino acid ABC transporter permease [Citricoccus sp. SGAir0253]|uniref:AzlC family ABC transporter permease n=1 Tax=Citricoccus sp. SGAir0253 TaxID=2567881 RepID=UPI0010CCC9D3|nr:AzlC family ABC transporter permease [Citricoccus sp. SGAir0253]QCU78785.1 branched-chain amino acid ABC transporter permease [Citricoccus sp. SGAir0253]
MDSSTRLGAHPAFRTGASVSVATGLYGISFGALSVAAGLDLWQTVALSALMFTGGSQFAFIGVLAGGGGGAAATGAASLLGIRNAVYGMQVNAMLRPGPALKPLAAQVTIDESAATSMAQPDPYGRRVGFWTAGVGVWVLWVAFTVLGAVAGDLLGDPRTWGLDGAAAAAMLGLLWPRLSSGDAWALAVVAALVTTVTLPVLPSGIPILVAAAVAGVWGWAGARRPGSREAAA